jgi:hypothetical protein
MRRLVNVILVSLLLAGGSALLTSCKAIEAQKIPNTGTAPGLTGGRSFNGGPGTNAAPGNGGGPGRNGGPQSDGAARGNAGRR